MSFIKGRKVIVTGATGQIGSFLAERLFRECGEVGVLGRDFGKYPEFAQFIRRSGVEAIKCDISVPAQIKRHARSLSKYEILAHLSSVSEPQGRDFFGNARTDIALNLHGTVGLLREMKSLEGVTFASSMAVYGAPAQNPVDIHTPTEPLNSYGVCKLAAEKLLAIHCRHKNIPLAIIRYSSVYGPRNRSRRALPTFIKKALAGDTLTIRGDGTVVRDYVYVDDAVEGTVLAMRAGKTGAYNIGYGKPCAVHGLAKVIILVAKSKSNIELQAAPKDFDFVYDTRREKRLLGYAPKVPLESGLKSEMQWHISELPRERRR